MKAVGSRAHGVDSPDRAEIELAVEMRKQLVVARALPAQSVAKRVRIDRDQEQAGLAGKMFSAVSSTCEAVEK